jgi:predicted transglutaminase-like cysteine proteinase
LELRLICFNFNPSTDKTGVLMKVSAVTSPSVCLALGLAYCLLPVSGLASSRLTAYAAARPPEGAQAVCRAYAGACHHRNAATLPTDDSDWLIRANKVNAAVNRAVLPKSDFDLYGRQNVWALPLDNQGDCKHLALLKKQRLINEGVPSSNLLLALVIGSTNALHAVLIMRTNETDYVLDSLDSRILPWTATGYTVLKMQNPVDGSRWDVILEGPRARRG